MARLKPWHSEVTPREDLRENRPLDASEFDSLKGRGGGKEPVRKTPWGEIAWQLGGAESFAVIRQHEEEFIEPKLAGSARPRISGQRRAGSLT